MLRLPRRAEEELRVSVEAGKSVVVVAAGLAVQDVPRFANVTQREAFRGLSFITTHISEWKNLL